MTHLFVAATLAAALPFAGLPSQFEKIAPAAKGRVGVAAQLFESGETASLHGDEHFPMHSVYKLPISMAVLQRVNDEKEIGRDWETQYRNWATPKGALALLAALQSKRGLSSESQALLLKLMTEAIPGAKRLKGELPAGTVVAHKTGTGGTQNGITSATNDIGIITLPDGRHLAVAAFVSDSAANDDTRDAVIARLAKAAWDRAQSLGQ